MIRQRLSDILSPLAICVWFAVYPPADQVAFCQDGGPVKQVASDALSIKRHEQAVLREQCFPIEMLSESSQNLSRQLLLDAFDSEALFTLVGGLKPVSEGFFSTWYEVEPPETGEIKSVRTAMSAWRCGECYECGVLPYQRLNQNERYASGWIACRSALAAKRKEFANFFGGLGLAENAGSETYLLRIEGADQSAERWRGLGLLFGYPEYAVDFFVDAGVHYTTTGEFIERDFRNYPTHSRDVGNFVYAVPKLAKQTDAEVELRKTVDAILAQYREHRERHIVDDKPDGIVRLIRDWYDDGTGWCHPDHAMQKVSATTKPKSQSVSER